MYPINSKSVKSISICDLSKEWLDAASRVYAQGLLMEKPPGSKESLEDLVQIMRYHLQTYMLQESTRRIWLGLIDNQPRGLLDFYLQTRTIRVRFLCAVPPGQSVGTQLMVHLAQFAQNNGLKKIHTTVSSLDRRAMNFYFHHLGFSKTGKSTEDPDFDLFLASINPRDILRRFCQSSSTGK